MRSAGVVVAILALALVLSGCAAVQDLMPEALGLGLISSPTPTPILTAAQAASATAIAQSAYKMAPDFTLPTLDGDEITLSDLRGRPVLINFWATWCPPCRFEMPAMQRVYEQYKDQGFVILAVNYRESADQVKPFVEELGLTFPVLLDETGNVATQYRVIGLPSSYFVDKEGRVQTVQVGAMTEAFMEEQVQRLLEP